MDSKCGRSVMKEVQLKGFEVEQTAFLPNDKQMAIFCNTIVGLGQFPHTMTETTL